MVLPFLATCLVMDHGEGRIMMAKHVWWWQILVNDRSSWLRMVSPKWFHRWFISISAQDYQQFHQLILSQVESTPQPWSMIRTCFGTKWSVFMSVLLELRFAFAKSETRKDSSDLYRKWLALLLNILELLFWRISKWLLRADIHSSFNGGRQRGPSLII